MHEHRAYRDGGLAEHDAPRWWHGFVGTIKQPYEFSATETLARLILNASVATALGQ